MSLELVNFLENVRLRSQLEQQEARLNLITNHPLRLVYLLTPQLLRALYRFIRNHTRAMRASQLVVSQPAPSHLCNEEEFHVAPLANAQNQYVVSFKPMDERSALPLSSFKLKLKSGRRKLVIIHAYYIEEAIQILDRLKSFDDYDIALTTSNSFIKDYFSKLFDVERSACFYVPNIGRDVMPFLLICKLLDLSNYTHFVKIHTKRSQHLADGGRWFRLNINSLIGHPLMTDAFFDRIDDQQSSIYGIECLTLHDHLENNVNWLTFLFQKQPHSVEGSFIPGTMFIGSAKFIKALSERNLHLLSLEEEAGQLDGCLVHALERYFGYFAKTCGGECRTLDTLALKRPVA